MERWQVIEGFPKYLISDHGNVKSLWPSKRRIGPYLKPWLAGDGYEVVMLYEDGQSAKRYVHDLVCRAFRGDPPTARHQVSHRDNDRAHNRWTNLRWKTPGANMAEQYDHKTKPLGSRRWTAVLTETQVREIDALLKAGILVDDVAAKLGVAKKHVASIDKGRSWTWLTGRKPHEKTLRYKTPEGRLAIIRAAKRAELRVLP